MPKTLPLGCKGVGSTNTLKPQTCSETPDMKASDTIPSPEVSSSLPAFQNYTGVVWGLRRGIKKWKLPLYFARFRGRGFMDLGFTI